MAYQVPITDFDAVLGSLSKRFHIMAPVRKKGAGAFSNTDLIEYDRINSITEMETEEKSDFSFKDVFLPNSEVLFYFTEKETKVADGESKGRIVFLRSCDLHSVKRLDEIYLNNGFEDYYYKRLRDNTRFVLIGCEQSYENCFCVSMGTNRSDDYDAYVKVNDGNVIVDSKWEDLTQLLGAFEPSEIEVTPDYVTENEVHVGYAYAEEGVLEEVYQLPLWKEYTGRCISCGRCNFVCPTCTCFTMQDVFYKDNGRAGERRRVWASCHVDGYTNIAGDIQFRRTEGERMRFKVMHKINDYKRRFGYHMCTGCGRCDDICPEYISFSNSINLLDTALKTKEADHD